MVRVTVEKGFNPVCIHLGSLEDYVDMRHILNCPSDMSLKEYVEERNKATRMLVSLEILDKFKFELWKKLGEKES